MKKLLYGLAALPFLAGVALADQPVQLSDTQMDKITAGFDLSVIERSNTSWTQISIYETGTLLPCNQCYLTIGGWEILSAARSVSNRRLGRPRIFLDRVSHPATSDA